MRLVLVQELYSNFAFSLFCSVGAQHFIKATPLRSDGFKKCVHTKEKTKQNKKPTTKQKSGL